MPPLTVYVLKCARGKYYVGKTRRQLDDRIEEHIDGDGSIWTSMYKPMEVVETVHNADEFDEDKYTKKYMAKYGIENVRGGSYSQVDLPSSSTVSLKKEIDSVADKCFKCGKPGHYANACHKSSRSPTCYRCGRPGHYASTCYARSDIDGYYL